MRLPALSRRYLPSGGGGGPSPIIFFHAARVLFLIVGFVLLFLFTPLSASAQQNSYLQPNVDSNVTKDQHTLVQAMTIELMSSFICQIAGIDVLNPSQGCLGINPETNKLGYVPSAQTGGLLATGAGLIGALYVPPASGVTYIKHLADNFGIVKKGYAADNACQTDKPVTDCVGGNTTTGFEALGPIQRLWVAMRNLAYIFFILIFVLLGIAIMLRYKIDGHGHGQTVMSIQNQLPRIVVSLVMITFSYAIVGLLIDFMWVSTYVGINVLTSAENPVLKECDQNEGAGTTLRQAAYANILNNPVAYMNDIFHNSVCQLDINGGNIARDSTENEIPIVSSGIAYLSWSVGSSIGDVVDKAITSLINPDNAKCSFWHPKGCIAQGFGTVLSWIVSILGLLIVLISLLFALFKLFWSLLKSYAYVIIFTIIGPIFILMGLIPGSHNGFGTWLKKIFANLAVFPAAAFLIILARIVMDLYINAAADGSSFVTPLTGNPVASFLGPLLAFGLLMLAPELVNLVKSALGAPPGQLGGIIQSNAAAGIGPGLYPIRQPWNRLWSRGGHGENAGFLREKLAGTGTPRAYQKVVRSLGIAKGMPKDWNYHPTDISPTNSGKGS